MAVADKPLAVTESVDIEKRSSELATYSAGSLEEIKQVTKLKLLWSKERALLWVSVLVIMTVLALSAAILGLSEDATSRDWARQMLAALMGFAAGGIWHAQRKAK